MAKRTHYRLDFLLEDARADRALVAFTSNGAPADASRDATGQQSVTQTEDWYYMCHSDIRQKRNSL